MLELDKEYMLFLGKQEDGIPDTFYIKGGTQGAFLYKNNSFINNDKNMMDDVNAVISQKENEDAKKAF